MRYTVVVAYFFMLRVLELGTMLYGSAHINDGRLVVTILLPATKIDVMALSCSRSWGCVCDAVVDALACPFHAAKAQKNLLASISGKKVKGTFSFRPPFQGNWLPKTGWREL